MTTDDTETGAQPVKFELVGGLARRVPIRPPSLEKNPWKIGAFRLISYSEYQVFDNAIRYQLLRYSGQDCLEIFCGHESYFRRTSFKSFTAVDGCVESLLRYPHQDATRFACDLNQLNGKTSLQFLNSNSFDLASVCFGFIYPDNIEAVLLELKRVVRPGGLISFVESPYCGYKEYAKREFSLELFVSLIKRTGLLFRGCAGLLAPLSHGPGRDFVTFGPTGLYHLEVSVPT